MATDIADWPINAASVSNIDGAATSDVAESNLPRTLNNAMRAMVEGISRRHRVVTFFDDFLADAIEARISSTAGSGTANAALAVVAGSQNGLATLKSASDDGAHSANGSTVSLDALNFLPSVGGLAMEVRLKVDDITNVAIFVGFSDTISTTVELPIYKTSGADTLDSDATNACGVGFDTDGATDEWWQGGTADGTDTAATHSGAAPVNDTFVTIRVEVSTAGAVTGYIDDTVIGAAVASAINPATPVTPFLVVANRSAAQRILTSDYLYVQQSRA